MSVNISALRAKHFPDRKAILDLVDDYTLFTYYLNEEVYINQVILSPLRDITLDQPDTLPSFVIYESRYNKLRYFDHGKGGKGGDIFDFVQELYGLNSFYEACVKICKDFQIGIYANLSPAELIAKQFFDTGDTVKRSRPRVEIKDIISFPEFTAAGKAYWNQYYITPDILKEYNVTQARSLITDKNISTFQNLAFAYRIGEKYKIYQPHEPEHKFINNYPSNYVEGLFQLVNRVSDQDLLIITKSTKDVMVLRLLGYEAISPKGENILIPEEFQLKLKAEYKRIVLLFDNDKAGIKGSAKYNYETIWVPVEPGIKDISDYIKKYGPVKAYELLLDLLN